MALRRDQLTPCWALLLLLGVGLEGGMTGPDSNGLQGVQQVSSCAQTWRAGTTPSGCCLPVGGRGSMWQTPQITLCRQC